MKRSFTPLLALLFLLALTLTACQPATTPPPPAELESAEDSTEADAGSTERTVVTVWMPGDEARWMMESDLPARFEEQYPQYDVELVQFPWDGLHDKVLASLTGGELPDVFLGADHWVGEFAALGGLEPVEGFQAEKGYEEDAFLPNAWEHFRYTDGTIYAVPAVFEARVLFYRTDLLEEAGFSAPPSTLEELAEMGQELSNGVDQFGVAHQESWLDFHFFSWLVYAHNGDLVNEDGTACTLTEPATIEALKYYKSLYESNIIPLDPTKRVETFQGFIDGYYVMAESGPWWLGLLQDRSELEGKWAATVLPSGKTELSYGHPNPWIVPAGATNKEGAFDWISFMLQPEIQAEWHLISGQIPVTTAAFEDERLSSNENLQPFLDSALRGTRSLRNVPNAEAISEVVWNMLSDVRDNVAAPEQAAADACNQINSLLEG